MNFVIKDFAIFTKASNLHVLNLLTKFDWAFTVRYVESDGEEIGAFIGGGYNKYVHYNESKKFSCKKRVLFHNDFGFYPRRSEVNKYNNKAPNCVGGLKYRPPWASHLRAFCVFFFNFLVILESTYNNNNFKNTFVNAKEFFAGIFMKYTSGYLCEHRIRYVVI